MTDREQTFDELKAEHERLKQLLIDFEWLPVRRHTQQTVVFERGPLDEWRAKSGYALMPPRDEEA